MSPQSIYQAWKKANGKVLGDGQCVSLVVNNSEAYVEALFPGVSWPAVIGSVVGAKDMLKTAHPAYFKVIENDHNDPNQLPEPGDIMVFDATPQSGYTNTFNNPYGHTGICEGADAGGYYLAQQNAPSMGQGFNITRYAWKFRPCLGWLRPMLDGAALQPKAKQLQINPGNWAVYTGDGKASPRLPGLVQGGQKYGPVQIATNGWAIIQFTGKTGHIEPAAYHLF